MTLPPLSPSYKSIRQELSSKAGRPSTNSPFSYNRTTDNLKEWTAFLASALRTLRDMEHWIERFYGSELTEIRFKKDDKGVLCIIKATHKGKCEVAFLRQPDYAGAIIALAVSLGYKSLRWKPDRPWNKRST